MFKLIIDQREKVNIDIFHSFSSIGFYFKVETLTIGDYGIYYNDKLLFVIERKTWKDFAASIIDNRLEEQIDKLLTLPDDVVKILLIEGKKSKQHNRIPIKNLEAKLDSIMFHHDIPIIYTTSFEKTAERIIKLIEHYPKKFLPKNDEIKVGGKNLLKVKITKTEKNMALNCLCAIPSVSHMTAVLILKNFTVIDFLNEKFCLDSFSEMKYESGTKIGKDRATKIIKNMRKNYSKILEKIPGISKKTSEIIIKNITGDSCFCDLPKQELHDKISLLKQTQKRKIGLKIASKITEVFFKKHITVMRKMS